MEQPVIIPGIVKRALVYTLTSIGQISHAQQLELDRAVRNGCLAKGKGGPFPLAKTIYAHPGFDFASDRERHFQKMCEWAHQDAIRNNDERYELRSSGSIK